ncbi:hypothetical protein CY35_18G097500 [Sphagnum magellanicum]|nr:hypothetical protein CY35_18G097500 [Sphagnum magellanicum]
MANNLPILLLSSANEASSAKIPMQETVLLMEDILIDYITDTVHKAQDVASRRGKLTTEDIMFLVRKDARKFARVKELLAMNEELKRARKAFEVDEDKLANEY